MRSSANNLTVVFPLHNEVDRPSVHLNSPDVEAGGDSRLFTQVHIHCLTCLLNSGGPSARWLGALAVKVRAWLPPLHVLAHKRTDLRDVIGFAVFPPLAGNIQ